MLTGKPLYGMKDVDKANSFLTDIITDALDKAAPLTRIQTRRKIQELAVR